MIANKTQEIENVLPLRLVCDDQQRKNEVTTIRFAINRPIFVHVLRFDESEASIRNENGVRV